MSDTFTDGQTVTADDLNNIARDLGYADYSHFPETPPLSAVSALNQITADLVGAGVLQGLNKCVVTCANSIITVATGIIVFATGAKKRITTPITFDLNTTGTNYIYALNDVANNKISLVNSTTDVSIGDYVKLASVSSGGAVIDLRTFSKANVNFNTLQNHQIITQDFQFTSYGSPYTGPNISINNFSMIFINYKLYSNSYTLGSWIFDGSEIAISKYISVKKEGNNLIFNSSLTDWFHINGIILA